MPHTPLIDAATYDTCLPMLLDAAMITSLRRYGHAITAAADAIAAVAREEE